MEGLVIALILIPIIALISSSQDKAETERIQGMSDSQLENRLVELCNSGVIAGPAGAVVGAISAADQNSRSR